MRFYYKTSTQVISPRYDFRYVQKWTHKMSIRSKDFRENSCEMCLDILRIPVTIAFKWLYRNALKVILVTKIHSKKSEK